MEDEPKEAQSSERQHVEGGTLAKLADIRLGPVSVNLRILLEPIGFLRIILLVLSIFAFSLTAGYMSAGDANQATCSNASNVSMTVSTSFQYPYFASSFSYSYNVSTTGAPGVNCGGPLPFAGNHPLSGSCQFFVGLGVLTFLYCLVILPVYVFVYTVTLDFSKYIAIVDCCVSIGATIFFFFANVAWSAGTTDLRGYIAQNIRDHVVSCLNCTLSSLQLAALDVSVQNTTQLSFSLLFGWVMMVVWGVTIWFSYKETIIHIKRIGPFYTLLPELIYKVKGGKAPSREGGGGEDTDPGSD